MKEQRYICFENSEKVEPQNIRTMKEKVTFIVMCIIAFFALCSTVVNPFPFDYEEPEGDIMPMVYAMFMLISMILAPVVRPYWMLVWIVLGTTMAILCGMSAFIVYVIASTCIITMAKFNPHVQDMIRNLWSEEEDDEK